MFCEDQDIFFFNVSGGTSAGGLLERWDLVAGHVGQVSVLQPGL